MNYLDHHMHTEVSHDSQEKMENYVKQTDNEIITTEHLDFEDPSKDFTDLIPNYKEQRKEIERLNKIHKHRIYTGIEIGWSKKSHDRIMAFLEGKSYDLKLLSLHSNGTADYMEKHKFETISKKDIVSEYFKLLIEAVEAMQDDVDVMAHFDYGFRVHDIPLSIVDEYGREDFEVLCKLIIENEICFELNTSSMYRHKNLDLYEWAVPIYQKLGGRLFTLGSDAHQFENYQYNFDKAILFLKKHGVNEIQQLYGKHQGSINI